MGMINAIKSYLNVVDIYLSIKPTMNIYSFNTKVCSGRSLNLISSKTKDFIFGICKFNFWASNIANKMEGGSWFRWIDVIQECTSLKEGY